MNARNMNATATSISFSLRVLQQSHAGTDSRDILTIIYLVILGLCFVIPILYYIRLQCDEQQYRNMRALEMNILRDAFLNRITMGREEAREARRKYNDERRARLLQLFGPVRMTLSKQQFTYLQGQDDDLTDEEFKQNDDVDLGPPIDPLEVSSSAGIDLELGNADAIDESGSHRIVRLPLPGLQAAQVLRDVAGECAICISSYKIGDDVVWSSNPLCEHCFHTACMEKWLMEQLAGSLCPCCRRDFVIDPLDKEGNENSDVRYHSDIVLMESDNELEGFAGETGGDVTEGPDDNEQQSIVRPG